MDSAIAAFCSTTKTATPEAWMSFDDLEVLLHQRGGQAHRRLVHQQQPRPRHQRATHRDHLLLAAGQRAGQLAAPFEQAREQRVHPVEVLVELLAAAQHRAKLKVLPHRHLPEQPAVLRHDRDTTGDPLRHRPGRHVLAAEQDPPGARPHDAQDRLERGRLAGGVPAEQADQLTLVHVQRDPFEDPNLGRSRW
jgi:hypothetical protein